MKKKAMKREVKQYRILMEMIRQKEKAAYLSGGDGGGSVWFFIGDLGAYDVQFLTDDEVTAVKKHRIAEVAKEHKAMMDDKKEKMDREQAIRDMHYWLAGMKSSNEAKKDIEQFQKEVRDRDWLDKVGASNG